MVAEPRETNVTAGSDLNQADLLQLHIAEYNALRAEQRQRLDLQARQIQYFGAIVAAAAVAIFTLWDNGNHRLEASTFLLALPILLSPFALSQQNEEMMVRRIGAYLPTLKGLISTAEDGRYWQWEIFHVSEKSWPLKITGFFRQSLVSFFALASLGVGLWIGWKSTPLQWLLSSADLVLIVLNSYVGYAMLSRENRKSIPTGRLIR